MSLRKILSMAIVVCLLATQMATVVFAEELPAGVIETVEETAELEEIKAEPGAVAEAAAQEEKEETKVEPETVPEAAAGEMEKTEAVKAEEAKAPTDIILISELDDVIVTLKADKDAFENEGELSLVVTPVGIEDTEEEAALDAVEKENVAKRVTYDITVFDGETPIEPVKEVKVSFELKGAPSGADGVNIFHHDEEDGIEKIAAEELGRDTREETAKVGEAKADTVTEAVADKNIEIKEVSEEELAVTDGVEIIDDVTVDGFSLYTVDFTYKDKTISIAGDSYGNKLDEIVSQLGIEEKVEEATTYQDAECTEEVANGEVRNKEGEVLFSVYEIGDSWYVDTVNAFQTEHGLIVKTADGAEYKIKVTDAAGDYLTFTANTAGSTIKFAWSVGSDVKMSTDGGLNWSTYSIGTEITLPSAGDKVSFKGMNVGTSASFHFVMTGSIAASGDVTSLTNGTGGDATLANSCYGCMFLNCTSLTTAPALPATTLAEDCYNCMFDGCTNLTTAPALPATTLAEGCYISMFGSCAELTAAPALPATEMKKDCYGSMFQDCTKLTTAPVLPAETLVDGCYAEMFSGCTSLTATPALPATTLALGCYSEMFKGCTNLTATPALPATTLALGCYSEMFKDCTNLTTVPALPAVTLKTGCYSAMFAGCSSLYVSTTNQSGLGIMMNTGGMSDSDLASCAPNMFDGILNITELGDATPKSGNVYYAKTVTSPVTPPYVPSSSGGSSSAGYASGWHQSGSNWKYVKSDGSFAKNEWIQIDGKWYHFGADSLMDTGWFRDADGTWYYFNTEGQDKGAMYTGWLTDPDDGYRYYLDSVTGKMVTGSREIEGKTYHFTDNVPGPSGWSQNASGDWFYIKSAVIPLGALIK